MLSLSHDNIASIYATIRSIYHLLIAFRC